MTFISSELPWNLKPPSRYRVPGQSFGDHSFVFDNVHFLVLKDVFSPARHPSSGWFVKQLASHAVLHGKRMIEVGCGCGFAGQYLAVKHHLDFLTSGDINPRAILCTRQNMTQLGLQDRALVGESNVYSGLSRETEADIIYWNHPWVYVKTDWKVRNPQNLSFRDPGYQHLERYIEGATFYSSKSGRTFLGFGEFGNRDHLAVIARRHGAEVKLLAADKASSTAREFVYLFEIVRPTGAQPVSWPIAQS